jgi:phage host-nuclease inhibitor protein Gam
MTIDTSNEQVKIRASVASENKKKEYWFFPGLFKALLINICINILIWGGVIATVPFFGPQIENFLFPSVKLIQKMRSELDRVGIIQDEKNKELTSLSDQTRHETTKLTESIQKLNAELKTLRDEVAASRMQHALPESGEISIQWNELIERFEKGEAFEKQLHALDPLVADKKDILRAIHELKNVSSQQTVPFDVLKHNLVSIKEKISGKPSVETDKAKDPAGDSQKTSWLDKLWEKAQTYISIERTDQLKAVASNPSAKQAALKTIDQALSLIEKQSYEEAIKIIKEIDVSAKPIVEQWLVDAEMRISVTKKIEGLRLHLTPLLVRPLGSFVQTVPSSASVSAETSAKTIVGSKVS